LSSQGYHDRNAPAFAPLFLENLERRLHQGINNEVGSASMPENKKRISKEESSELCGLLKKLAVVSEVIDKDGKEQPPALEESFASDRGGQLSQHDMDTMLENWVAIEEDPEIQESEYEDALETLEKEDEEPKVDAQDKNNDPMVLDDNDSDDDDDSTIGFKNHFEAEEALQKAKVFAKKSGYPKKVRDNIDHAANGMRVHRVSKKTTSPSILAYFSPSSTANTKAASRADVN
jgi:hypothetical protein